MEPLCGKVGDVWMWEGGWGKGLGWGVVEVGAVPVGGFFYVCVERTQHSNLFHIPKTNQAGYFHSGIGLMVEVGLNRLGVEMEQHADL